MRGVSWLAAGGLLTAMGIRARTHSPFSLSHELRDAACRRDAPAISEKVDLRTLWLFDADRAKSRSSGELKAPDQGAIGAVKGGGIGAMVVRLIDALLDQAVAAQTLSALLAWEPILAVPASSPPSQPEPPAAGWVLA